MEDSQCVAFLQWALPRLGMRWAGFRKVRRQVCKRLGRRLAELGLPDLDAYRAVLESDPDEWPRLEKLTHITISRFHRDRGTFEFLLADVLPTLAGSAGAVRAWSAGCASGEEPYTLSIMWELRLAERFPSARFEVLASDVEEAMLGRARRGCYGAGSLRALPERWRTAAFAAHGGEVCLRARFRELVSFERHDVLRDPPPDKRFDLVLCRNLAFTYFDEAGQRVVAEHLGRATAPGGALVLGRHETLPENVGEFEPWSDAAPRVYRRCTSAASGT